VLAATKPKYRSIDFQTVDLTKRNGPNGEIAAQYGVRSLPTIILLDGNNNVLFKGTPPFDREGLAELFNRFP
jgi:thioredoxin-related protein